MRQGGRICARCADATCLGLDPWLHAHRAGAGDSSLTAFIGLRYARSVCGFDDACSLQSLHPCEALTPSQSSHNNMDFLKKAQAQMGNHSGGTTAGNPTAQPGQPGAPAQGSGGGDFLDKVRW